MTSDEDNIAWCRALFTMLHDGGRWGVPRSGLLFKKEGQALTLIDQMPWEVEMPGTEAELKFVQKMDFEAIKEEFGKAGIEVRRRETSDP